MARKHKAFKRKPKEDRFMISGWPKKQGQKRDNLWKGENSKPGPVKNIPIEEYEKNNQS